MKTKTKSFQTTIYPFLQTDFLIDELIGKARFWEMIIFGMNFFIRFNSHASSEEKCVEIVKTLHVKFFPFGSVEPVGSVTVNFSFPVNKV